MGAPVPIRYTRAVDGWRPTTEATCATLGRPAALACHLAPTSRLAGIGPNPHGRLSPGAVRLEPTVSRHPGAERRRGRRSDRHRGESADIARAAVRSGARVEPPGPPGRLRPARTEHAGSRGH